MIVAFEILNNKPEQEKAFLQMIVNKLGDPTKLAIRIFLNLDVCLCSLNKLFLIGTYKYNNFFYNSNKK